MSHSPLVELKRQNNNDGLSAVERLANDSQIRYLLERELSDHHFRLIQLYFTQTHDLDKTLMVFNPIRPLLITETKMASTVNKRFVDLVAVSEFWQENLLLKSQHGVLSDYGSQFTNCRRRRKIKEVLNRWRLEALSRSSTIIESSYMSEDTEILSETA